MHGSMQDAVIAAALLYFSFVIIIRIARQLSGKDGCESCPGCLNSRRDSHKHQHKHHGGRHCHHGGHEVHQHHGHHNPDGQSCQHKHSHRLRLCHIEPGQSCLIRKIHGHGSFRRRLMEMGFLPGCEVELCKFAPLGDPAEYIVKGTHVSLRHQEAEAVEVENPFCPTKNEVRA